MRRLNRAEAILSAFFRAARRRPSRRRYDPASRPSTARETRAATVAPAERGARTAQRTIPKRPPPSEDHLLTLDEALFMFTAIDCRYHD